MSGVTSCSLSSLKEALQWHWPGQGSVRSGPRSFRAFRLKLQSPDSLLLTPLVAARAPALLTVSPSLLLLPHQVLCRGLAQPLLPKASEPQFPQGLLSQSHMGAVSRCSPTRPRPVAGQAPLKVLRPGRAASARRALPGLALPSHKPVGGGPARAGAPPVGPSAGLGDGSRQCPPSSKAPHPERPQERLRGGRDPTPSVLPLSQGWGNGGPQPLPHPRCPDLPRARWPLPLVLTQTLGQRRPQWGSLVLTAKGATPRGRGRQQGLPRATKPGAM